MSISVVRGSFRGVEGYSVHGRLHLAGETAPDPIFVFVKGRSRISKGVANWIKKRLKRGDNTWYQELMAQEATGAVGRPKPTQW